MVYWPVMGEEEGCVAALERLGIAPQDVRYVLRSHLHVEHIGAAGRFPDAVHIVRQREYEYAMAPDWFAAGGYIRADFDRPDLKWHLLEDTEDGYDVSGDGLLSFVFPPGHAPGHSSFLLRLPQTGAVILAVDAAYTMDQRQEKTRPGFVASSVHAVRSVKKLHALAEKTRALVVTGHESDAWPGFKQAPE